MFESHLIFFPDVPSRLEGDWHPSDLPVQDVWLRTFSRQLDHLSQFFEGKATVMRKRLSLVGREKHQEALKSFLKELDKSSAEFSER